MRSTFIENNLIAGMDIFLLAPICGHSIQMLTKHYERMDIRKRADEITYVNFEKTQRWRDAHQPISIKHSFSEMNLLPTNTQQEIQICNQTTDQLIIRAYRENCNPTLIQGNNSQAGLRLSLRREERWALLQRKWRIQRLWRRRHYRHP